MNLFVIGCVAGALGLLAAQLALLWLASRDKGADLARQRFNRRRGWRLS
jgi:hypothetical protein